MLDHMNDASITNRTKQLLTYNTDEQPDNKYTDNRQCEHDGINVIVINYSDLYFNNSHM